jgi:hypothetical protein
LDNGVLVNFPEKTLVVVVGGGIVSFMEKLGMITGQRQILDNGVLVKGIIVEGMKMSRR